MKKVMAEVSPDATVSCNGCGKTFTPRRSNQKSCTPSCRVRAHRSSPKGQAAAARRSLNELVERTMRRVAFDDLFPLHEAERQARLNRDRSFIFDGRYSGPIVAGVPGKLLVQDVALPVAREEATCG
jgi:hypothetical protein